MARPASHWLPSSLRARLLLGGIVLQAAVLAAAAMAVAGLVERHLETQLQSRLSQMTPLLNSALSAPMAQRDYATVEAILVEMRGARDLSYLCVFDSDGRLIAEARTLPAAGPVAVGASAPLSKGDLRALDLVAPLTLAGQPLGRVEFGLSRESVDATRASIVWGILGISAAALALFSLLLTALGYTMTRPLQALVVAARDIHDGHYDIELDTRRRDELGVLSMALHKLSAEVLRKVTELTRSESQQRRLLQEAVMLERDTREALTQAEAANRAKSDFIANMSHEVRTPMNAIVGHADLLMRTPLTVHQQSHARAMQSSGARLLAVVNDVLDFSKIEAGRMDARVEDFDLVDTVDQVVTLFQSPLRERGLHLRLELDADLPRCIRADGLRLQQVLVNLVGNAAKFTNEGSIELRLAQATAPSGAPTLSIKVRDTGIGIAADQLERIFEPFSQADGSITRRFGGTGLGLTISRRLLGLMGGSLSVTSEPGHGSTFHILLPYEPAQAVRGQAQAAAVPATRADPTKPASHPATATPCDAAPMPAELQALLDELAGRLRLNLLAARGVVDQIERQLAGTPCAGAFEPVAALTRRLQFPQARAALQVFVASYGPAADMTTAETGQ